MEELPYGTGSLYVTDPDRSHLLKKETRALNSTERAEAVAVQYLLLGGHSKYTGLAATEKPVRVFSSIHTGPGQIVFGYSEKQRADLTLAFKVGEKMELHYFNYHGYHWHYDGHMEQCPSTTDRYTQFFVDKPTQLMDSFRSAYAEAMSQVLTGQVTFHYHVVYECELVHGVPVPSFVDPHKTYYSAQELLAEERAESFYLPPPPKVLFDKKQLMADIAAGKIDGFVTLRGGREGRVEPPASNHFGFCVQNYAPSPDELSQHTKAQIAEYYNLDVDSEQVNNYLLKQAPRTLNSTTFHSEETISTNYLRWLMQERDFCDFEITHFLWYKFGHQSRRFIEPLLQLRHEMKKQGNLAAAEVLKLILNGAYG
jgi:hypothetical protein